MNYKDLFKRIGLLISDPEKAWIEIYKEHAYRDVSVSFVYPLIGLCGLSVFIGTFFGNTSGPLVFQIALMKCGGVFISLFAGFFLAAYIVQLLNKKILCREESPALSQCYVGYSMVVVFILLFVSGLLNISILYWILMFYTVYVAYVGARVLLRVENSKITVYSLAVSFTIICCPIVISFLFDKLSVILN